MSGDYQCAYFFTIGATVHISTLDGTVALKVPPGTTAEQDFRFSKMFIPAFKPCLD